MLRKVEAYKDHFLYPSLCRWDEHLSWTCHIELVNGKWLWGDRTKSFDTVEAALNWAKETIELAACPLFPQGQALEQQLAGSSSHLLKYANAMLKKYLPKATVRHQLLLKYLLKQFEQRGSDKLWDYFLARAFAVVSQKFLGWCRDLAKAGLIRYWRFNQTYLMEFYLGPAWLSVEGLVLSSQELSALALGEEIASYRPWCKAQERYLGEHCGFPRADNGEKNLHLFSQVLKLPPRWEFYQEGKALLRVPVEPNRDTWHSTWQDSIWTHTPLPWIEEDTEEEIDF